MAAKWESVTTYKDCPPGPQSGVTDDLKDLSEVRDNYSGTLQNTILITLQTYFTTVYSG